jgi:chromate transporter
MNRNLSLFLTFLKIGAFTFGGGYAMIPLISHELVEKKKWITEEEMINMIAIAESTPGVIAVNSATFVGYKIGKFWGSLLATLGVVLPSLAVIIVVALFFEDFLAIPIVANAFRGIRAGVIVLIISACVKLYKFSPKTVIGYALMAIGLFVSLFVEFRYLSFLLILFGLVVGIGSQMIIRKVRGDKQ